MLPINPAHANRQRGLALGNGAQGGELTATLHIKKRNRRSFAVVGEEREDGTPAGTRTRARGLGNRCSIRLSYRGT